VNKADTPQAAASISDANSFTRIKSSVQFRENAESRGAGSKTVALTQTGFVPVHQRTMQKGSNFIVLVSMQDRKLNGQAHACKDCVSHGFVQRLCFTRKQSEASSVV
jgi:hypothetical protein